MYIRRRLAKGCDFEKIFQRTKGWGGPSGNPELMCEGAECSRFHLRPGPGYILCSESDPVTIGGKGNGELSGFLITEVDGSLMTIKQ